MKRNRILSFLLAGLMMFSLFSVFPSDSFNLLTPMEANAAEGRLYNQNDSYWSTITFSKYASSGNSLMSSGCGIFSFCNAIYALNDGVIDAVELAAWAVNNGSFQPGNGGLYRQAFYNQIQSGYGDNYGFKIDGQYFGTISDSRLIDHLQNGGVAVIHVYNHFMAATGYNASNGTYHVIESAVSSRRGLDGDSWVSSSILSSGSTDVDWYALISSTVAVTTLSSPQISINRLIASTGDSIVLSWNSVPNATWYFLSLFKDGEWFIDQGMDNQLSYSTQLPVGDYIAYVCAGNGAVTSEASSVCFSIYDSIPDPPQIMSDKTLFSVNEDFSVQWEPVKNSEWYYISLYKDGELYINEGLDNNCSYSNQLPAGDYIAYVCAGNSLGASAAGSIIFSVYDSKPTAPNLSLNNCNLSADEHIEIKWSAVKNAEWYYISLYKDGELYIDKGLDNICSYSEKLPVGEYIAYICAGNSVGASIASSVTFKVIGDLKVWLDANGGTCSIESFTVAYGGTYSSLPKPSRSGYTFDGWYTAASGGTKITETTNVTATTNHTLYAHWTANKYTITFNTNGGTCDTTSKSVTYNSTYGDLPTPICAGYVFNGWYTEAEGGTQITEDTIMTVTTDQTLYAHWERSGYVVTFDAAGGIAESDSKQVVNGKEYGVLPSATKSGYEFAGWYTEDGVKITSSTIVNLESNITLYARWESSGLIGDINLDGQVSVVDAVYLSRYVAQDSEFVIASDEAVANADCNFDGQIDASDITAISLYLAGLATFRVTKSNHECNTKER